MQISSQIITNKPTPSVLHVGCPSCRQTNSVKALKGDWMVDRTVVMVGVCNVKMSRRNERRNSVYFVCGDTRMIR